MRQRENEINFKLRLKSSNIDTILREKFIFQICYYTLFEDTLISRSRYQMQNQIHTEDSPPIMLENTMK